MKVEVQKMLSGNTVIQGTNIPHSVNDEPATISGGQQIWCSYGAIHRDGGPAVVSSNFNGWYKNGRLHRDDGPASIELDGGGKIVAETWFKNDLRHRTDGPAEIYSTGTQGWWKDGKRHRIGGIAYETPAGKKEWWREGYLHNLDGPALVPENRYFIAGREYTEEAWKRLAPMAKLVGFDTLLNRPHLVEAELTGFASDTGSIFYLDGQTFEASPQYIFGNYLATDGQRDIFWGASEAYAQVSTGTTNQAYKTQQEFDEHVKIEGDWCWIDGKHEETAVVTRCGRLERFVGGQLSNGSKGARIDIRNDIVIQFCALGKPTAPTAVGFWTYNLTQGLKQGGDASSPDGIIQESFEPSKRLLEMLEGSKGAKLKPKQEPAAAPPVGGNVVATINRIDTNAITLDASAVNGFVIQGNVCAGTDGQVLMADGTWGNPEPATAKPEETSSTLPFLAAAGAIGALLFGASKLKTKAA